MSFGTSEDAAFLIFVRAVESFFKCLDQIFPEIRKDPETDSSHQFCTFSFRCGKSRWNDEKVHILYRRSHMEMEWADNRMHVCLLRKDAVSLLLKEKIEYHILQNLI